MADDFNVAARHDELTDTLTGIVADAATDLREKVELDIADAVRRELEPIIETLKTIHREVALGGADLTIPANRGRIAAGLFGVIEDIEAL